MPNPAPAQIRRIFLNPRPNVVLMTAADLLGMTLQELIGGRQTNDAVPDDGDVCFLHPNLASRLLQRLEFLAELCQASTRPSRASHTGPASRFQVKFAIEQSRFWLEFSIHQADTICRYDIVGTKPMGRTAGTTRTTLQFLGWRVSLRATSLAWQVLPETFTLTLPRLRTHSPALSAADFHIHFV